MAIELIDKKQEVNDLLDPNFELKFEKDDEIQI